MKSGNPIYIHMRQDWPAFRWDETALSPLLTGVRHAQGLLLGRMEGLGFPLKSTADMDTLTEEIVQSSAIEGENLDARQVRSSIARKLGLRIGNAVKNTHRVDGVVEMMLDAVKNFNKPLTATRLYAWHAALFPTGHSGMRKIRTGAWRTEAAGAMQVVSGPVDREKVHFEAPTASRLNGEMKSFLQWFNAAPATDPVIHAALAHFRFVTVHPFEDGNGRMARAIADMGLARSDGAPQRFYSMSAQIEMERKQYYDILERSQKGDMDLTDWLTWFLECLGRSLERAQESLSSVLQKAEVWRNIDKIPVNERQRKVINRLLDGFEGKLTTSKYAKLTQCSTDTALRDIRELIAHGILAQNPGGGRSTSYRIRDLFSR